MGTSILLRSAAVVALVGASIPLTAQSYGQNLLSGDIQPFSGDINPFSGDISPFSGDISPFRGDIDPFYGDINPFWGDISPFWGDINPFTLGIGGDINPFWGDINPFSGSNSATAGAISSYWSNSGPAWGDINTAWDALNTQNATNSQYLSVRRDILSLVNAAGAIYGNAVRQATGKDFRPGFANAIFAKYGINLNQNDTLKGVSAEDRSRLFLDWYDGLQSFSGADYIDHWMATVNWSPAVTQDQGNGHDAVIGLLDVAVSVNDTNIDFLVNEGGYQGSSSEHGAAVASLIAARHDGQGLMGIAPRATIHAYSPFDATGKATFAQVNIGVNRLTEAGANVINMSLGVPGWAFHQEIADILTSSPIQQHSDDTIFVIASGNDGIVQTQNIEWGPEATADNLLIVGSVNPNKTISFFSNQVGQTCLTVKGVCHEENRLKNRFLVAPGELILVSDNNGGTTRLSGTSFSAPLVTGAISLLHDRWPWLQNHAKETADIILQSAEDLGAPGVDAVYGHGLLDVAASQSPLDFNNLTYFEPRAGGGFNQKSGRQFRDSLLIPGQLNIWQNSRANIFAIEEIGDTYRDFTIPLSTLLYEQSTTFQGNTERYQRHVHHRLVSWAEGGGAGSSFTDSATVSTSANWTLRMTRTDLSRFTQVTDRGMDYHTGFEFTTGNGKTTINVGEGIGARFLTYDDNFASTIDEDREAGGVNPYLGFASGGTYASFSSEILPEMKIKLGFSEGSDDHSYYDDLTGNRLREFDSVSDYEANALSMGMTYAVADRVELNAAYTRLNEKTGILGAQGGGLLSLDGGAITNAMTIGASYEVTPKLTLSVSGTSGKTVSKDVNNFVLEISDDGLMSTAFELAATSNGILQSHDRLRVRLAQPLHVETGELLYRSVQVVDRTTGELGGVDEFFDLGGTKRRIVSEAEYGFPVMGDRAEMYFYGRIDMGNTDAGGEFDGYAGGIRFSSQF